MPIEEEMCEIEEELFYRIASLLVLPLRFASR
jgi:hypothetical protein